MPCYKPLPYVPGDFNPLTNKLFKPLVLPRTKYNLEFYKLRLPCSRCVGCRLERSRQWAIRCVHEASLYENNCFITLTYAPSHLPKDGSLDVREFQLFMKRLRKKYGEGIRFFHCGEYGEKHGRPHYHAILFNFDFSDKYLWKEDNGYKLYRSPSLEALWPYGHSSVGTATFESAAYVARYILKKVTGDSADDHYLSKVNPFTGEVFKLKPEYTTMSRRPGIASAWYDLYKDDVHSSDSVVIRARQMRPPRFYDSRYELTNPEDFEALKEARKRKAEPLAKDLTEPRLAARLWGKLQSISLLVRNVDKDL
jgi:hypothetical protein